MISATGLNKYFFSVINNSLTLAQVFIVILFFENYFIITQKISLFQVTIDFDNINLSPILWFFVFIAISRLGWFIFSPIMDWFKYKIKFNQPDSGEFKISMPVALTIFMLSTLCTIYLCNVSGEDLRLAPINPQTHFWAHRFFMALPSMTAIVGFLFLFLSEVDYWKGDK